MTYKEKAEALFKQGYNCSQAVLLTFSDQLGLDKETALKLSSSFGGGMGRLREVCGAVSSMFMVAGRKNGYTDPCDQTAKKEHYALIQRLAEEFKKENGSIVCRELLGLANGPDSPNASPRTEEYYKKRPCGELCGIAAELVAKELGL